MSGTTSPEVMMMMMSNNGSTSDSPGTLCRGVLPEKLPCKVCGSLTTIQLLSSPIP